MGAGIRWVSGLILATLVLPEVACAVENAPISVRTERYPRPPYSSATYYLYEREGQVICTKLEVCNKYDHCNRTYRRGAFKDPEDVRTGDPYGRTAAVVIPQDKLRKHQCLVQLVPDAF